MPVAFNAETCLRTPSVSMAGETSVNAAANVETRFTISLGPRSWGTRFDSLTSPSPPRSLIPHKTSPAAASAATDQLLVSQSPTYSKEAKDAHDTSVFVGSLPTNVEHGELSRLLSEHLSPYTLVKNIKIIRDHKGGICAFVQCESAAAAANLIQTMRHQPVQPFMGRYLRYEQARVLKSLLISYRVPMHTAPANRLNSFHASSSFKENVFELKPASAMRLSRPRGSKFVSVLYNADALQLDQRAGYLPAGSDVPDLSANAASIADELLLSPLRYDAETIHKISSYFGRVESCRLFRRNDEGAKELYPPPHNVPRSSIMDSGCWEVKWERREDCCSAFTTLRAVPHLTVTWAHSLSMPQFALGRPKAHSLSSLSSPDFHSSLSQGSDRAPASHGLRVAPYMPSHLRTATHSTKSSDAGISTAAGTAGSPASSRHPSNSDGDIQDSSRQQTIGEKLADAEEEERTAGQPPFHHRPDADRRSPTSLPTTSPTPLSSSFSVATPQEGKLAVFVDVLDKRNETKLQWGDTELSPLSPLSIQSGSSQTRWADAPSLLAKDHMTEKTRKRFSFTQTRLTPSVRPDMSSGAHVSSSDACPSREGGRTVSDSIRPVPLAREDDDAQAVEFPTLQRQARPIGSEGQGGGVKAAVTSGSGMRGSPHPVTIFAGGLEMYGPNAWDEAKVQNVFGKYGTIVEITVIKPGHKRSAFAFITYEDAPSASRAMAEEHNKVYDGRQIRVQPHRGAWATGNRGRPFREVARRGPANNGDLDFASLQSPFNSSSLTPDASELDSTQHTLPTASTPEPSLVANTLSSQSSSVPTPAPAFPLPLSMLPPQGAAIASNYPPMLPPGYYPTPSPWFAPYPYPVPFTPRYAPGHPVSTIPTSCSTAGVHGNNVVYPHFSPYPAYPFYAPVAPPGAQFATPTEQPRQLSAPSSENQQQPPLLPTGFLQGEQGLVAMYQPEALNQYMSNSPAHTPPAPGAPDRQRSASTHSASTGPPYGYPPFYAPSYPMPLTPSRGQNYLPSGYASPMQNIGWHPPNLPMNSVPLARHPQITSSVSRPTVHNPTPMNATSHSVNALLGTGASPYIFPHGEANPSFRRRNRKYNAPSGPFQRYSDARARPGSRNAGNYGNVFTPSVQHPPPDTTASMGHIDRACSAENVGDAGIERSTSSPARFDGLDNNRDR